MIPNKIELTRGIKNIIINCRKDTGLSSYDFSVKIGKSKYWFANLETGKSKFITKDDLFTIVKSVKDIDDEKIEIMIENVLNDNTQMINDKPIEIIAPSSEEKGKDYFEEYNKVKDDIMAGFDIIFKNIEDKEYTIKLLKRLKNNMHTDLGYSLSIFSLPWCHLSNLDKEKKVKIINDIFEMIKQNGHECADCKSCKDKNNSHDEDEEC